MKRLCFVIVLSSLYVGGYFALVGTQKNISCGRTAMVYSRVPVYYVDNRVTRIAFAPLLRLDEQVRPRYWSWTEPGGIPFPTDGEWEELPDSDSGL